MTTRYLICGRRDGADLALVDSALGALILHPEDAVVIHGDARPKDGCGESYDRAAGKWARDRGAEVVPVPADWDQHGAAAGPIRNREMLFTHRPDVVIAFPGGPGTRDMVKQADDLRRQRNTHGGPPIVIIEVTGEGRRWFGNARGGGLTLG